MGDLAVQQITYWSSTNPSFKVVKKEYALEFKNYKERVDVFLYAYLNDRKEFQEL